MTPMKILASQQIAMFFFHKTEYIIYCFALTPQTGVNGPFNDIMWKKCDLYDADNTLHPVVLTCANS